MPMAERVHERDGAEMVLVAGGAFKFGASRESLLDLYDDDDERVEEYCREFHDLPASVVALGDFWIDKYPVTNRQYRKFLEATRHRTPRFLERSIWGEPGHPVVGVDWSDAWAYAAWAGKRLPTEEEWEKAARGVDGRLFPWGEYDESSRRCNSRETGLECTSEVGSFPRSASPCGAQDMAGNVWEMTSSTQAGWDFPVMRGGCFLTYRHFCRATARWAPDGEEMDRRRDGPPNWLGFRCVWAG